MSRSLNLKLVTARGDYVDLLAGYESPDGPVYSLWILNRADGQPAHTSIALTFEDLQFLTANFLLLTEMHDPRETDPKRA